MFSVLSCIAYQHDLRLVAVAALVCSTACCAAFGFHLRALAATGRMMRGAWMALTALVAGCGVWATHFIAMLAYQPHLPIAFDLLATVVSLLTAVIGVGAGFGFAVLERGRVVNLAGGALSGLAVAAMHFMGIAALRAQAHVEWNVAYAAAAIGIGVVGAACAFEARARLTGRAGWAVPALVLVLAIVGLHFTAMTAVRLVPDPALVAPEELLGRDVLALCTAALAGLIVTAATGLIWMEGLGRRATLRGLRGALDAVPTALSFYDSANRLVAWNAAYGQIMRRCGLEPREGSKRSEQIEAAMRAGWRPLDGGDYMERRKAAPADASASAVGLQTPEGRIILHEVFSTADGGSVTALTDVTEQREIERNLAAARDSAEAIARAKGQFLANMSHEIRTPLNGVLGVADVLAATRLTAKQRELVGVIQSSGSLLDSLLSDLLDLASAEAGAAELRPQPTDLRRLAVMVRDLHAPAAEQKGLALSLEIGGGAGELVACDATRLRQVLGNLVANAVKFTDSGAVVMTLDRSGDRVAFAVRDTGVGFDERQKAQLFGSFEQGDDSSTRRYGGAGLGLPICKEYVALMGGELDCTSAPGVGSTFGFALDLPILVAREPFAVVEAANSPDQKLGPFRVLIVDDNAVNRQVLSLILDSVGVEHASAEDGRAGVEAARTGRFDLVLMDLQMPVMDGFEATRRIRAWEAAAGRPRLPIYIVSANCLQEHVDAGVEAGADGHLSKPVSVPQLLAALEPHAAQLAA